MAKNSPAIQLHEKVSYSSKRQPDLEHLPQVPLRGFLLGPSGSGKSAALVDMILRLYRGCFERVYVFSPSVHLDSVWVPVKEYVEKDLKVEDEQCFFDTWDAEALRRIYETQVEVVKECKRRGMRRLYSILIVVDDFADNPTVSHQTGGYSAGGSMLNTLFVRGRHAYISTLVSTQKLRLLSNVIRVNAQFILVWRLRNRQELQSLLEELSAVHPIKTLQEMYELAVREPFSFWYILLTAKRPEEMFFLRFEQRLVA